MKVPPTFFIVPGFKQKVTDLSFAWLRDYLKKKGFNVIPVPIKWSRRVMSDYISDFRKCYLKNKTDINYVLGFSYGAIVTLTTANELQPDKIFLCSLSPEFSEDIGPMKSWHKKLVGKRRLIDSNTRSGKKLARELMVPSVVCYGEKEGKQYPQLKIRCEETVHLAKNSKLVVVPKSPHQLDNPEYVKKIIEQLDLLK